MRCRSLALALAISALSACGGSGGEDAVTATSPRLAPACATYVIDGTVLSVGRRVLRVEIDDAGGSGEGRIATVASVRLTPALRRVARPRAGRRIRAEVRDCAAVLVARRILP